MKITYELTAREIKFLIALKSKDYPINAWSGRMSDDSFRSKWKTEIQEFHDRDLCERKDSNSPNTYWTYGLNDKGLELQKNTLETL